MLALGARRAHAESAPALRRHASRRRCSARRRRSIRSLAQHARRADGRRARVRHAVPDRSPTASSRRTSRPACPCVDAKHDDRADRDPEGHRVARRQRADRGRTSPRRSSARARSPARWLLAPVIGVERRWRRRSSSTLRAPRPDLATLLALPQTAITKAGKAPGEQADRHRGRSRSSRSIAARIGSRCARSTITSPAGRTSTSSCCAGTTRPTARRGGSRPATRSSRRAASAAFAGGQPTFAADDVEGPGGAARRSSASAARMPTCTARRARSAARSISRSRAARSRRSDRASASCRRARRCRSRRARRRSIGRRDGDLAGARRALARRGAAWPRSRPRELGELTLEILVEDTRPDDREIAERVVARARQARHRMRRSRRCRRRCCAIASQRGDCDLWIGQLAAPVTRARPRGGARRSPPAATTGSSSSSRRHVRSRDRARRSSRERLPIVPLMFRSVRIWHRTDVRGVALRRERPAVLRRPVPVRRARADERPAVKLRGRFTLTLALAALVPIAVAAVVTTRGDRVELRASDYEATAHATQQARAARARDGSTAQVARRRRRRCRATTTRSSATLLARLREGQRHARQRRVRSACASRAGR